MANYIISGRVVDRQTGRGLAGLKVEAWDKDMILNDMVGSAVTDEKGAFRIKFDRSYFMELFGDRSPDLYFKVFYEGRLIHSTKESVLWNVAKGRTPVTIKVDDPVCGEGDIPESRFPLTINDRGEQVAELHNSLDKLGYKIPGHELDGKIFGVGTRDALLLFQRDYGLRCSGKLDERTRAALARAVSAGETGRNQFEGRIYLDNGLPAAGVTLRFYCKGFAGAQMQIGQALTDEQGYYAFSYDPAGKANNIEVRCLDAQGEEIPISKTKYDLTRNEILNLVVPASIKPVPAEYGRMTANLVKEIGALDKLAGARENTEQGDLTLLHKATGWDARLIALAATAVRLGKDAGVPPEYLYALFRVGLPTDRYLLSKVSDKALNKALDKALEAGIVALDQGQVTAAKEAFKTFAITTRRQTKTPGASSSFGELLANAQISDDEKGIFEDLYFSHRGTGAEMWKQAEERGISPESVERLRLQGKLAVLTYNNAELVESLQKQIGSLDNLPRLVDQDLFKPEAWKARIESMAGDDEQALADFIPPAYAGEKTADRLELYAADLARKVRMSFPTRVVRRMVETGDLKLGLREEDAVLKTSVGRFLQNATGLGFKLGRMPTGQFIKQHHEQLSAGIDETAVNTTINHVKRLHRLYQITPSDDSLKVLDSLGFSSAYDVTAFSKEAFHDNFAARFPSPEEAELVYRKAQQVNAVSLNVITMAKQLDNTPPVYAVFPPPKSPPEARRVEARLNLVKQYPSMESLFGSLDFCECEHCRSVLSPAAYFVDLLKFLDPEDQVWNEKMTTWESDHDRLPYPFKNMEAWEKYLDRWRTGHPDTSEPAPDTRKKPFEILEGSRPDLPHLALTCENTHTALPYIDVVNEILEYYVANGGLSADAVHDTDDAETPDLLAEPHYIITGAYDILRDPGQACYPLVLPFDLWLETVRRFVEHFDTPFWKILEAFLTTDELFSPAGRPYDGRDYFRAAVFAEYLGISPAEYELFCVEDPLTWYRLYGYNTSRDAMDAATDENGQRIDLNSAKTLARRLELSYRELIDVVRTGFINPGLDALVTLRKLGMDTVDVFRYMRDAGYAALSDDEASAFETRLDELTETFSGSGFDARRWLDETWDHGDFNRILVLSDPDPGCDFNRTILRYANGSQADPLVFIKINLFVRLWRKLGWTMEETDRALRTFLPHEPEDLTDENIGEAFRTALIYLAHLKMLDEKVNAGKDSLIKLLTLWSDLPTTGLDPLYARLFLTPSVQKIDPVFDHPLGRYLSDMSIPLRDHLPGLQAALNMTVDEIGQILADAGNGLDTASLTLANVSLLYRYKLLAQSLRLSVRDFIILKALCGIDPFTQLSADPLLSLEHDQPFTQTLRFVEIAGMVEESGFRIGDIDYLLRHNFDPVGTYRDDPAPLLALLKTLSTELHRIREEHAMPADPAALTDDMLLQKLALILQGDVAETFHAMWSGKVEYEAVQTGIVPGDRLAPDAFADEPAIRVSYDELSREQRLIFRGVLLHDERVRLEAELSWISSHSFWASRFPALLDSIQADSRTFFETYLLQASLDSRHTFGFLEEDDFELLFSPDSDAGVKRARIAQAFLPYLQDQLSRRFIIQTLAANRGADPAFIETLITDPDLLRDPGHPGASLPLLSAFEASGEQGVSVTYTRTSDPGTEITQVIPAVNTTALDTATGTRILPGDLNSAIFDGYVEVPAGGVYRFYATCRQAGTSVELCFAHLTDPFLSGTSTAGHLELICPVVELKAGVPYRFTLSVRNLGDGDLELMVQGEDLAKGSLAWLKLYPDTAVERVSRARILLTKVWQIIQGFDLGEREVRYLLTHPDDFDGLSFSGIPLCEADASAGDVTVLFRQFLRLADYVSLRRELAAGEDLIDLFEHARSGYEAGADPAVIAADMRAMEQDLYGRLAEITRREITTVEASAQYLGFGATTDPVYPEQLVVAGFTREQGIRRVWEILQIVERLGVSVNDLASWATPAPDAAVAGDLKNTVKARYEPENWRRIAQPIFDKLRRRQCDALVAFILQQMRENPETAHIDTPNKLYEYFLIDPGMEPVVQTSRIQLAISSVQLFIQRCLMNLEPAVAASVIDAKQWQWMMRYRVWEANRKIFLFPENWLEPEFRDDKTHLFQALEGALLQGDVSNELAENAFFDYLKGLETISRLEIVTMYLEEDPHDRDSSTLHVIGRTYNAPKYFYRRYANSMWTPWEPVTANIQGDHVAAVVWRQRLHLFWVTFLEKNEEVPPEERPYASTANVTDSSLGEVADEASIYTRKVVEVQLNWCEYFQGKWTTPESGGFDDPIRILLNLDRKFNKSEVFIHATKEYNPETGVEGALMIHLWGKNLKYRRPTNRYEYSSTGYVVVVLKNTAFRVVSKNSSPDVIKRSDPQELPYRTESLEATQYKSRDSLQLIFKYKTAIEEGRIIKITQSTKDILTKGGDFSLLFCSNLSDLGSAEMEGLLSRFFYEDNLHTFFVEPSLIELLLDHSDDFGRTAVTSDPFIETDSWGSELLVDGGSAFKPPGSIEPIEPIPVDLTARYAIKLRTDWATDPNTVLKFEGCLIGAGGALDSSGSAYGLSIIGGSGLNSAAIINVRGRTSGA